MSETNRRRAPYPVEVSMPVENCAVVPLEKCAV